MVEHVTPKCEAASLGYTCDRDAGHGMIHHHPVPGPCGHDDWWIIQPHDEDEAMGMKPMSGYLLVSDFALPKSKKTEGYDGDLRIIELWIESVNEIDETVW